MRYDGFSPGFSALVLAGAVLIGCGGRDELAVSGSDACPLPRRTPVASFVLTGDDGSWTGEITPGGIVFRTGALRNSIAFDYAAPRDDGVVSRYTSVRMAADTHRIDIALSTAPCGDNEGTTPTHRALVWVDRIEYVGCAVRKAYDTPE